MTILMDSADPIKELISFHPYSFGSASLKRVARSTVQADTYNLQAAVGGSDVLRAASAQITSKMDETLHWEAAAAKAVRHVWFTDCHSTL